MPANREVKLVSLHLVLSAQAPLGTSLVLECCVRRNDQVAAHLARCTKASEKMTESYSLACGRSTMIDDAAQGHIRRPSTKNSEAHFVRKRFCSQAVHWT